MWACTNLGSGTGNRLVRCEIATGKLTYAQGADDYFATGWASDALGAAVFRDGSSTGTCFANINDTPDKTECRVLLTGPVGWNVRP